jgi:hypothetical protein
MTVPIARRYYYGTTAVLRPGDEVKPASGRVDVTIDAAQALADAWRAAESGEAGVPHVYELSGLDGKRLVVVGDVVINGNLAWRATQIADT